MSKQHVELCRDGAPQAEWLMKEYRDMTAATAAALSFFATFGHVDQCDQPSPRLLAPCLGLALVAGAALWLGISSIVVLLVA